MSVRGDRRRRRDLADPGDRDVFEGLERVAGEKDALLSGVGVDPHHTVAASLAGVLRRHQIRAVFRGHPDAGEVSVEVAAAGHHGLSVGDRVDPNQLTGCRAVLTGLGADEDLAVPTHREPPDRVGGKLVTVLVWPMAGVTRKSLLSLVIEHPAVPLHREVLRVGDPRHLHHGQRTSLRVH